jgi:hypothetical protein
MNLTCIQEVPIPNSTYRLNRPFTFQCIVSGAEAQALKSTVIALSLPKLILIIYLSPIFTGPSGLVMEVFCSE